MKHLIAFFILLSIVFVACKEQKPQIQDKIIISVNNEHLTATELKKAISPYENPTDSAKLAEEYIDNWLTERLMYKEAEKLLSDTAVLAQKINSYRRQLYIHEYCTKYIYSNVNMTVTEKEITNYYDAHLNDYVINTSYVKAHYITLSAKIARYYEIFDKLRKSTLEDEQELNDYCAGANRNVYFVKEWVEFQDFRKLINHKDSISENDLRQKNTLDYVDDTLRYLVKIDDYLEPGDLLPIELAKPKIIQIIINNRRHDKYIQAKNELLNKYKPSNSKQ